MLDVAVSGAPPSFCRPLQLRRPRPRPRLPRSASAESETVASAGGRHAREPARMSAGRDARSNRLFTRQAARCSGHAQARSRAGRRLATVQPSGPAGRVTREDVERASSGRQRRSRRAPLSASAGGPVARAPRPRARRRARARCAACASASSRTWRGPSTPPRTSTTSTRSTWRADRGARPLQAVRRAPSVKLTFLPFIVKAVVAALKRHPGSTRWSTKPHGACDRARTTTSVSPSRPTPG